MASMSRRDWRNSNKHGKYSSISELVEKAKERSDVDLEDIMVIGIEFGMINSAAAWATVTDFEADRINLITSWPEYGREAFGVPTELFYECGKFTWGYGIPSDVEPIRWFNLLLLREEDLDLGLQRAEYILHAKRALDENGKTAVGLTADYLGCLWKHILDTINKAFGKSATSALTFHVVVTVPAALTTYAYRTMEMAIRKAGILNPRSAGHTTFTLVPQLEAAALASIYEPGRVIDKNRVYVMCDVDEYVVSVASYVVNDTDPIRLNEAVARTGGLCGSKFINEAFEAIVKARLGRRWRRLSQAGVNDIMTEWEYAIKHGFKVNGLERQYIVSVPAEAFTGATYLDDDDGRKPIIKNGRIHFTSSDIQDAYVSAFSDIDKLVSEQIRKARNDLLLVSGIILVGSSGSIPYLHEYLASMYTHEKIAVFQSSRPNSRMAACRGTIFKGFLDIPPRLTAKADSGRTRIESFASISIKSDESLPVKRTILTSRNLERLELDQMSYNSGETSYNSSYGWT